MTDDDPAGEDFRISVEASSIDAIADALELERTSEAVDGNDPGDRPVDLEPVVDTLADLYRGVETATEHDSRGRSRKMVREYAGREDLDGDAVGHLLRVLEIHGLVAQDGNRWRTVEEDAAD